MNAVRETWTDERLDDLRRSVGTAFAQSRQDHADLRGEVRAQGMELRKEMKTQGAELRGEMQAGFERIDRRFEQIDRRFEWLTRSIVAALVGVVITHFV